MRSVVAAASFSADAVLCVDEVVDDAESAVEVDEDVEEVDVDVVDVVFPRLTGFEAAAAVVECDERVEDAVVVVEGVVESAARLGSFESRRTSPPPSPPSLLWINAWWVT